MEDYSLPTIPEERFDWLQLEITSHCNAACVYCPRTVYRQHWDNRHLDPDVIERLFPVFPRTELIYLQGWGEPLMYPDFFELARRIRATGSQVGFTTNGMLLNREKMESILDLGIYVVAFSLAGLEHNDQIRQGTRLEEVLRHLHALATLREQRGSKLPRLHIAYMLLRSGLEELPQVPPLLSRHGADEMVISTLDFVPTPELSGEALIPRDKKELGRIKKILQQTIKAGRRSGLAVHYHLPYPWKHNLYCTENVLRAAFIGVKGTVSPCTFTNLPVTTNPTFARQGEKVTYEPLILGDLRQSSWEEIWSSPLYQSFRASFRQKELFPPCRECPKLWGETV
ncbi:radical SAM protein [Desulfothermobacter acidiphilus]|uniref:radical SAM protein n=1 Tax=Desulfothermobacter acidiphilus TaxID=1938353 RepID=UPI003F89F8C9